MERQITMITDIHPETRNWTARITITEDIPVMTCATGLRLKRYIFTDEEGNQTATSILGEIIPVFTPVLHPYKVYEITNAQVRFVQPQYRILDQPNQWILQRHTLIRPISQAAPNLRHILDGITPINLISKIQNDDTSQVAKSRKVEMQNVDIMDVVIKHEKCENVIVGGQQTIVQNFTFADTSEEPIRVSIWGEMTTTIGPALVEAANNNAVVIAKRLKITHFRVISLRSKNSSSFGINPPIQAAADMKSWFRSRRDILLPRLLEEQPITIYRDLVNEGSMKIHTVSELKNTMERGDFWVRGSIELYEMDQKLYYIGCGNCQSKIDVEPDVRYDCCFCEQNVVSKIRPLIIMSVTDHTGSIDVTAFDNLAEQIIQATPSKIIELRHLGEHYDLSYINNDFQNKRFLMLLRRTSRSAFKKRPILIEYYDETHRSNNIESYSSSDNASASQVSSPTSANKGKSTEITLSPLKRQIIEIRLDAESASKKQLFMMPQKEAVDKAPKSAAEEEEDSEA